MINFTSQRNEEAIQFSGCSLAMTESEDSTCKANYYFFASVHAILSLTSLTGNILILIALQRVSSLHSSSKLLFRCLSCTDLIVGLFSQPIFVTYLMAIVNKTWNICELKGHCHDIWQLYKKQEGVFASSESKTNGLVLLLKTV